MSQVSAAGPVQMGFGQGTEAAPVAFMTRDPGTGAAASLALPESQIDAQVSRFVPGHKFLGTASKRTLFSWSSSSSTSTLGPPLAPASATGKVAAQFEMSVFATQETLSTEGLQRNFTAHDVESSTGTFGDLPRFIQTLAGVVSDNDQRNDFLVRGGTPTENLFVIDNIEIPSINQLALSDTTGGLVSMLDNNAIRRFSFQDDAYSSHYDQRLSSVVDISTRTYGKVEPHREAEFGIDGTSRGASGDLLLRHRRHGRL